MFSISHTFDKSQRLKSKKIIQAVFDHGNRIYQFPLNTLYLEIPAPSYPAVQVMIAVPKRKIRKAHDRNLIKRRIREAYRTNKHMLFRTIQDKNTSLAIVFVYSHHEILEYRTIEQKIILILQRLSKSDEERNDQGDDTSH